MDNVLTEQPAVESGPGVNNVSQAEPLTYNQEDVGIFIGFLTAPFVNIDEFHSIEIESVFRQYKEQLGRNLVDARTEAKKIDAGFFNDDFEASYNQSLAEFEEYLYIPKTFVTLGRFDLAVLAITDDFDFGVRTFQSCSPSFAGSENEPGDENHHIYQHQNINAVNPWINCYKTNYHILDYWKNKLNFPTNPLRPDSHDIIKLNLIGFCSLKINSSLVIGNSKNILKLVLKTLHTLTLKFKDDKKAELKLGDDEFFRVFEIETLSWNELTSIAMSNSYGLIAEYFQRIKELTVGDIYNAFAQADCLDDADLAGLKDSIRYDHCKPAEDVEGNAEITMELFRHSHLFVKSSITLGFDYDLVKGGIQKQREAHNHAGTSKGSALTKDEKDILNQQVTDQYLHNNETLKQIFDNDRLHYVKRWYIRPGHKKYVDEPMSELFSESVLHEREWESVTMGSADYSQVYIEKNSRCIVKEITQAFLLNYKNIHKDTNQSLTVIDVQFNKKNAAALSVNSNNIFEEKPEEHEPGQPPGAALQKEEKRYFHKDFLSKYQFGKQRLDTLFNNLKKLRLSKSLSKDIESCFTQFNEHINDNAMYGYFIELYPHLNIFYDNIADFAASTNDDDGGAEVMQDLLFVNCTGLRKAFENRLQHSYYMAEISDHCFEFKGGAHQLISMADGAYKFFASEFGLPSNYAFYSSNPSIVTNQFYVRINLYHLIQPEILLSIALHESAHNFRFAIKAGDDLKNAIYDIITDLDKYFAIRRDIIYKRRRVEVKSRNEAIRKELHVIQDELADYILVDMIMFYVGCNGLPLKKDRVQLDYFLRVKWLYFIQLPDSYDRNGSFNRNKLMQYFSRMVIAEYLYEYGDTLEKGKAIPLWDNYRDTRAWRVFKNLIWFREENDNRLVSGNNNMSIVPDVFRDVLDYLHDFLDDEYAYRHDAEELSDAEVRERAAILKERHMGDDGQEVKSTVTRYSVNEELSRLTQYVDKIAGPLRPRDNPGLIEDLLQGKIVERDIKTQTPFQFINDLSYNFLKLFYADAGFNKQAGKALRPGMLIRSKGESGSVYAMAAANRVINFDPRGGTFVVWPNIRRGLFRLRMAVSRSVLQAYNADKKNYKFQEKKAERLFGRKGNANAVSPAETKNGKKNELVFAVKCFISFQTGTAEYAEKIKQGLKKIWLETETAQNGKLGSLAYYIYCKAIVYHQEGYKRIKDFIDSNVADDVKCRYILLIDDGYLNSPYCLYELVNICLDKKKADATLAFFSNNDVRDRLLALTDASVKSDIIGAIKDELHKLEAEDGGSEAKDKKRICEYILDKINTDKQYEGKLKEFFKPSITTFTENNIYVTPGFSAEEIVHRFREFYIHPAEFKDENT